MGLYLIPAQHVVRPSHSNLASPCHLIKNTKGVKKGQSWAICVKAASECSGVNVIYCCFIWKTTLESDLVIWVCPCSSVCCRYAKLTFTARLGGVEGIEGGFGKGINKKWKMVYLACGWWSILQHFQPKCHRLQISTRVTKCLFVIWSAHTRVFQLVLFQEFLMSKLVFVHLMSQNKNRYIQYKTAGLF